MWTWKYLKSLLKRDASADVSTLGAVMWPVVYPNPEEQIGGTAYVPKDPHITIVVFRDIDDPNLGFTKDDVIDVIKGMGFYNSMLLTRVTGLEYFGPNKDVPVLTVEHGMLQKFRDNLIEHLAARGISVDMTYPDYRPHVTITPVAAESGIYPDTLLVSPVEVWWGEEHFKVE